jgi:hypothetical protein
MKWCLTAHKRTYQHQHTAHSTRCQCANNAPSASSRCYRYYQQVLASAKCHSPQPSADQHPEPSQDTPDPSTPAHLLPTSCAIRGTRGGDIGHRSPPGSSEELGWAGCGPGGPIWPLGRWVRWPVTPTGTGAGSSAPPPYRRLAAGAEAARVLGS